MPPAEQYDTYEVFTARGGGQPLKHAGNVRAPDPKVAAIFARAMYDEWRWREMFVVPRKAIIRVIRPS